MVRAFSGGICCELSSVVRARVLCVVCVCVCVCVRACVRGCVCVCVPVVCAPPKWPKPLQSFSRVGVGSTGGVGDG